jgi:hypothetical protein
MRHQDNGFRILSECADGYIGMCTCCREFNFAYKTILLSFQEEDMQRTFNWLIANGRTHKQSMPMRHGRRGILSSELSNLYLVFNKTDLEEIKVLFQQALLLLEVENVLLVNRHN